MPTSKILEGIVRTAALACIKNELYLIPNLLRAAQMLISNGTKVTRMMLITRGIVIAVLRFAITKKTTASVIAIISTVLMISDANNVITSSSFYSRNIDMRNTALSYSSAERRINLNIG
jgi:hypothetical protein